eukprot:SAG11_NODE_3112_length_2678_cov_2.781698_1_plen_128_part_10
MNKSMTSLVTRFSDSMTPQSQLTISIIQLSTRFSVAAPDPYTLSPSLSPGDSPSLLPSLPAKRRTDVRGRCGGKGGKLCAPVGVAATVVIVVVPASAEAGLRGSGADAAARKRAAANGRWVGRVLCG